MKLVMEPRKQNLDVKGPRNRKWSTSMSPMYRKRIFDVSDLSDGEIPSLYETWIDFSAAFKALVDDRIDIRDIENLFI